MDRRPKQFKNTGASQKAKWFDGLGPVGMDYGLDGYDCAIHDSKMILKYPIPLHEQKKPLRKVLTEEEMDEAIADYEVPPDETPLQKALREDEEQEAKEKQGNNIPKKSTSTETMFSNPQKGTPSYRIQQIARVGVDKSLCLQALSAIVDLL
ncbi:uncharacterized protein DMAD_00330 [Drosophila madeirensis]|uniref:Uncharacterized protein n=1 Tax=Drosophila madeirensis TaxID=30013 RepID=A0AAU9FXH2_DROMD